MTDSPLTVALIHLTRAQDELSFYRLVDTPKPEVVSSLRGKVHALRHLIEDAWPEVAAPLTKVQRALSNESFDDPGTTNREAWASIGRAIASRYETTVA